MKKYLSIFVVLPSIALASTPDEDANASIAICQAIITIGKQQPELPDKPPQAVGPEVVAHAETQGIESDTRATTEEDSPSSEALTAVDETGAQDDNAKAESPIAENIASSPTPTPPANAAWSVMVCTAEGCDLRNAVYDGQSLVVNDADFDVDRAKIAKITIVHGSERFPGKYVSHDPSGVVFRVAEIQAATFQTLPVPPVESMRLVIETPMSATGPPAEKIRWRRYSNDVLKECKTTGKPILVVAGAKWCLPCKEMERTTFMDQSIIDLIESSYLPVRIDQEEDAEVFGSLSVQAMPAMILLTPDDAGIVRVSKTRLTGKQSVKQLKDFLGDSHQNASETGCAGSIYGAEHIHGLFDWWRSHVGEGVKASMQWDRTGGQSFPLLANGDWSALAVCGRYGHVQLTAKGAVDLPVEALGFGYRVEGDDITIDADPITMKGVGLLMNPNVKKSAVEPARVGTGTILTIISVVRGVWSLLHPTCDLQLGGNVSATGVLNGNKLSFEFQQCPSIKLVALFTFQVAVKRIDIDLDRQNVHLEFSGSRWLKSRDFAIKSLIR